MKNTLMLSAVGLSIAGVASAGTAGLPVNQDLGTLSGTVNLVGDTANGQNAVDYYEGLSNVLGNWSGEFVYAFTPSALGRLDLQLNAQSADTDFHLLNGLDVLNVGGKNAAQNGLAAEFLDGALPDSASFGLLFPGQTYYLSVETFNGFDGALLGIDSSTYDLDVSLVTDGGGTAPSAFIDLGTVANEYEAFNVNSNGSAIDTEIGIWTSGGLLIGNDDDGGEGAQSLLDFAGGLPAGDYYVALGEFNTTFGDGFAASGGDAAGDWVISANGTQVSGSIEAGEIQFARFTVVPAPGAAGLLGLAGIAGVRRRR